MSITSINPNQTILAQSAPKDLQTKNPIQATLDAREDTQEIKPDIRQAAFAGAISTGIPTLPIGLFIANNVGTGTGAMGVAAAGLSIGTAGVIGGLIGGAVAASTTESKLKGALFGGSASALAGAALVGIVLSKSGLNVSSSMKMAALAFGVTGAIGGVIGSNFAVKK